MDFAGAWLRNGKNIKTPVKLESTIAMLSLGSNWLNGTPFWR